MGNSPSRPDPKSPYTIILTACHTLVYHSVIMNVRRLVMSEEQLYKVKIEGCGLSLEREVLKAIGDQVVVLILTGQQDIGTTRHQTDLRHKVLRGSAEMSLREFLNESNATKIPEKITAIGNYLMTSKNNDVFNRDDIITGFESAAESVPKNLPRDIKWTLKAGWIALKTGTKDQYYVTHTGKQALEGKFSSDAVKRARQGAAAVRKARKKGNSGESEKEQE